MSKKPSELFRKRLNALGWEYHTPKVASLVAEVGGWLDSHINSVDSPYLTICGSAGCGKTTIADAVLWTFDWHLSRIEVGDPPLPHSRSCGRVYGPDHVAVEWSGFPDDKRHRERQRNNPYLLIYDDFGSEASDNKKMAVAESMFLRMLENRRNKKTIVTTNIRPEQMEKEFDGRIVSRLIRNNSKIINTSLGDYALKP